MKLHPVCFASPYKHCQLLKSRELCLPLFLGLSCWYWAPHRVLRTSSSERVPSMTSEEPELIWLPCIINVAEISIGVKCRRSDPAACPLESERKERRNSFKFPQRDPRPASTLVPADNLRQSSSPTADILGCLWAPDSMLSTCHARTCWVSLPILWGRN